MCGIPDCDENKRRLGQVAASRSTASNNSSFEDFDNYPPPGTPVVHAAAAPPQMNTPLSNSSSSSLRHNSSSVIFQSEYTQLYTVLCISIFKGFFKGKKFFLFMKNDHLIFCILSAQIKTVFQTKIAIRIKI